MACCSPIASISSSTSLGLPKQAKPALRVLAPMGRKPRSTITTFRPGWRSSREMPVLRPVMPPPMMLTSQVPP